ncbi:lectin OAA [marine bacterium AO1-C]|nr:lectin OAA [marine bacterium AO1-C]
MSDYAVKNQWGGSGAPWHNAGTWVLGSRQNQLVVSIDIESNDNGKTFSGTITYEGEGPIGFKAEQISGNKYNTQNQWGGNDAPWHEGGTWVIGQRVDQRVVSLKVHSDDKGQTLVGNNTYDGEGPVGFIGVLVLVGAASQKTNQVATHA